LKGIEILKGKYVPKTPEVEEVKKDDYNFMQEQPSQNPYGNNNNFNQ